jgi:cation transport regulator ChaB
MHKALVGQWSAKRSIKRHARKEAARTQSSIREPPFSQFRVGGRLALAGYRVALEASDKGGTLPTSKKDLPGTLQRSPKKAQETYEKALDSAHDEYKGDESRAHRTAYAAVKHSYEKVGDHWEAKDRKGPSDEHAKGGRNNTKPTTGGVDIEGHTKAELVERAKRVNVAGASNMTKEELGKAIAKKSG